MIDIGNGHHDTGIDKKIESALFGDAPLILFPNDGRCGEGTSDQTAQKKLQADCQNFISVHYVNELRRAWDILIFCC